MDAEVGLAEVLDAASTDRMAARTKEDPRKAVGAICWYEDEENGVLAVVRWAPAGMGRYGSVCVLLWDMEAEETVGIRYFKGSDAIVQAEEYAGTCTGKYEVKVEGQR